MTDDPELAQLLRALARRTGLVPGDAAPAGTERFELGAVLGSGGNGVVYAARDPVLEREVALKALLPDQASADAARRLLDEARVTARLAHPGIVPVHEAGRLPDGRACYAMRKVAGEDLATVLDALRRGDAAATRAWPLPRLLRLYVQICQVVAYAHAVGVVHRDLKPGNILLGRYGEVYVGDWGLARDLQRGEVEDARRLRTLTQAGLTLGTPPYIPPEQARGLVDQIGPPADVYALGVMLYELLSLQRPFEADTPADAIIRALTEEAEDPALVAPERDVPPDLADLALATLERDPARRTLTAADLAERVGAFLDGVEARARREAEAAELLARAADLAADHRLARAAHRADAAALEARAAALPVDAPAVEREAVWRATQELAERLRGIADLATDAAQAATQALELHPTPQGHDLLAELLITRLREAEARGDVAAAMYFRVQVQQHDEAGTGRLARTLSDHGEARVQVTPADAAVRWIRHAPLGPVFEDAPGPSGPGPHLLAVGAWVAEVSAPGRLTVRVPVVVRGDEPAAVAVALPPAFPGAEDFVPVLGGRARLGGDPHAPGGLPATDVELAPYLIGRHPVTISAYIAFLDAVAAEDPEAARARAPRSPDGSQVWLDFDPAARRFLLPEADQDGDRWHPGWPVLMIAWHDAVAYCAWRSAVTGVAHRLPTDLEWELAARGVDGRAYPWGPGFDPTLCCNAVATRGKPMPSPVGSFPRDRSPWGVMDMAGLTMEWTSTPDAAGTGRYILRGGGHNATAEWCRAAARRHHHASWTAVQFGFRVVRAWPDGDPQ